MHNRLGAICWRSFSGLVFRICRFGALASVSCFFLSGEDAIRLLLLAVGLPSPSAISDVAVGAVLVGVAFGQASLQVETISFGFVVTSRVGPSRGGINLGRASASWHWNGRILKGKTPTLVCFDTIDDHGLK